MKELGDQAEGSSTNISIYNNILTPQDFCTLQHGTLYPPAWNSVPTSLELRTLQPGTLYLLAWKSVPSSLELCAYQPGTLYLPAWNCVPSSLELCSLYPPGVVDCHGSNSDVGFAVNQLSDNTVPFLGKKRKPSSQKMEYATPFHSIQYYRQTS
jgi:hypothetical protein